MPALIWALAPAKLEVFTQPLRPRAPKDRAGRGRKPAAAWSGHVISCAALWARRGWWVGCTDLGWNLIGHSACDSLP